MTGEHPKERVTSMADTSSKGGIGRGTFNKKGKQTGNKFKPGLRGTKARIPFAPSKGGFTTARGQKAFTTKKKNAAAAAKAAKQRKRGKATKKK